MVAAGELGAIRVVQVEYAQDWLTEPLEATGQKQAAWRTDPARSGAGGASATSARTPSISPHFVTGAQPQSAARRSLDLRSWPPRR